MEAIYNDSNSFNCGGMGAHDWWDRNNRAADKNGIDKADRCHHCGNAMTEGNGWIVRYVWQTDRIISLYAAEGELVRLGNECVKVWKKYYPEFKDSHFRKMEESN